MYDCIIIGTGPAGLSAAINLKTHKKNFIWFGSKTLSDKVTKAERITNYPGFPSITGKEFFEKLNEHIQEAGVEIIEKTVTSVMAAGNYYMVLANNEIYESKTIILAMGVMTAKVLEGEQDLLGKGVSYCATCDGMFYKDKKIVVICNTPKLEYEVEYLAELASEVTYFPTFESKINKENVIISKDIPVRINGDERVSSVTLRSNEEVSANGVFCLRNAITPSNLIPGIQLEKNHIMVDRKMATNLAGCFACGDCTGRPYQYTKAVGEGNIAAHSVISYLASQKQ